MDWRGGAPCFTLAVRCSLAADEATQNEIRELRRENRFLRDRLLHADGFQVDTAHDGEAALRRLRQKRYDLALCDWKMPGLGGQKLYERVRSEDPSIARRFIFMTGDVINAQAEAFLKQHRRACLSKPFSVAESRTALAEVVAAS